MLYKLNLTPLAPLASLPVSGAMVNAAQVVAFVPWEPNAWPETPSDDHEFALVLKRIFELSTLTEISNVIEDAKARSGSLSHREHVVAISLFCALDAISCYGYGAKSGRQMVPFIQAHFPTSYRAHADTLLRAYRHAMIHSWNLFSVAIHPDLEEVVEQDGVLSFGLLNLFGALTASTENFLEMLRSDAALMANARERYTQLKGSAKAAVTISVDGSPFSRGYPAVTNEGSS